MNYVQEDNVFYACGTPITVAQNEKGETHVYSTQTGEQLSTSDLKFGRVFGGGKEIAVKKTEVVMKSGFLYLLCGGSEKGSVEEKISLSLEGGMIGGYLFGGGIEDEVGDIEIKVSGGAIKYGFFGGGRCKKHGKIDLDFSGIVCTNVNTGSKDKTALALGGTYLKMTDGHILTITAGGGDKDTCIEISGGYIEKMIVKENTGELYLKLYENIFYPNGVGGQFPMLPEEAHLEYLPAIHREPEKKLLGSDEEFFSTADCDGKLVVRLFELRHPDVPAEVTPFPTPFVGDCIYITFPDGKNMLVDTGSDYSYDEVKDGLAKLCVKELDCLVITHPHGDHMGCAAKLLENVFAKELWIPDINAQPVIEAEKQRLVEYYELIDNAEKNGTKIVRVADGDEFDIGGCSVLVINPVRTDEPAVDMNENSVAFKLTYKENSALLCGDISDKSEKRLAEKYGSLLKCDLLKVAHHGIVYQSYYKFIDSCMPAFAVVPSMREKGVFLKTTRYALTHVNGFDVSKMYTTGRYGKIKVVMNGKKDKTYLVTQYK